MVKQRTLRDPHYLAWLRKLTCAFCGAWPPSEASHYGKHGIGIKPPDDQALPACRACHARWHACGSPILSWDLLQREARRDRLITLAAEYRARYERVIAYRDNYERDDESKGSD